MTFEIYLVISEIYLVTFEIDLVIFEIGLLYVEIHLSPGLLFAYLEVSHKDTKVKEGLLYNEIPSCLCAFVAIKLRGQANE